MSSSHAAEPVAASLFPRWVLILSVCIVISSAIPYLYQAAVSSPETVFSGFVEAIDDQNLYLTWVEQVRQGRWEVIAYATAEEAPPFLVSPPWLALGLVARVLPLPTIVTYHIVRLTWGLGYLLMLWLLIREFFAEPLPRVFAFVTAVLGSGFGALVDGLNALAGRVVTYSADLMPELWSYHSLHLPHFVLSTALMALLVLILLRAYRRPSASLSIAAFATMALLILCHPYNAAVLAPLLLGHFIYCQLTRTEGRRNTTVNLWAVAGILPPAAFFWWQTHSNPLMAVWNEQNVLRSPPPLVYLLGLGVVLPLAVWGRIILGRLRRETPGDWLMILWVLVTALVVYSYPLVPFERRCVEGVHIPLAILAGIALAHGLVPLLQRRLAGWNRRRVVKVAMTLLLTGILPTNIKLLADGALTDAARIPRGWVEGFAWIRANTPDDARFFTTHRVGMFLARYALRHVHLGHLFVTVDLERKREMAHRFFAPDVPDSERLEILRAAGCGWVAADARHAAALRRFDALQVAYDAGDLVIFRFLENPPPPLLPNIIAAPGR